jgi:hypothetical protein
MQCANMIGAGLWTSFNHSARPTVGANRMTEKHPIQAYFEDQEAKQHLREERQRQREQAQAEKQLRLDLALQRLKQAWIAVSPAIADAVARANTALTPYVDSRFVFAYSPSDNTATISFSFLDETPDEHDIIADLTLDISSSKYALHAEPRDDVDVHFICPSLSDPDLDQFFGELYKHATRDDEDVDA